MRFTSVDSLAFIDIMTSPNSTAADFASAAERVMSRCDALAELSEEPTRLTRTFCCDAMAQVHQRLTDWMTAANMQCRVDTLGNLIGRTMESPRVFMIGSHLDTVVDAGKYDGPLGVLVGLAAVELLQQGGANLPFAIDVIGFSEEEGVRFNSPFLGSRAVAGEFTPELLDLTDDAGVTVRAVLGAFGLVGEQWQAAEYSAESIIGFLEPHIEQGPVLENATLPVGVVTSIAGQTRSTFLFRGQSGHAGTVPHEHRKDALAAAAEFVFGVEKIGQDTDGLFATIGDLKVSPNISNVIAGDVQARLDLRHADDTVRAGAYEKIQGLAERVSRQRGLEWAIVACEQQAAIPMDSSLTKQLHAAIVASGHNVQEMVSGAGHDAVMMARKTPTSMLFLKCRGGVSHNPAESVEVEDVAVAIEVIVRLLMAIK